jgi:phosphoribosyl 1,2-cyclic phosphodiesterase/anti-sigma regulatory factor (Ser/Thr protein kinase)
LPAPLDAAGVREKVRMALTLARERRFESDAAIDAFIGEELPFLVRGTYGGNTSCVQIDVGSSEYFLCDAGSGLRVFGNRMLATHGAGQPQTYNILLSHLHWDHINGFPFFTPAYIPGNTVRVIGCHAGLREALQRQHGAPSFPVDFTALGAKLEFIQLEPGREYEFGGLRLRGLRQQHGGDSYGYRITHAGKVVVYATDAEHRFKSNAEREPFIDLYRDADLVIFDAMYSLGDSVSVKEEWGHSSNITGVDLAHAAGAKHLVLYHHEPAYDDALIAQVLDETRRYEQIVREGDDLQVTSAYDGLEIVLARSEFAVDAALTVIGDVRAWVEESCEAAMPGAEFAPRIVLVLEELLTNLVKYGAGSALQLQLALTWCDGMVELIVEDDGGAFDLTKEPAGPREGPGGYGLDLVRQLMDGVAYTRDGGLNRLTFRKTFSSV